MQGYLSVKVSTVASRKSLQTEIAVCLAIESEENTNPLGRDKDRTERVEETSDHQEKSKARRTMQTQTREQLQTRSKNKTFLLSFYLMYSSYSTARTLRTHEAKGNEPTRTQEQITSSREFLQLFIYIVYCTLKV